MLSNLSMSDNLVIFSRGVSSITTEKFDHFNVLFIKCTATKSLHWHRRSVCKTDLVAFVGREFWRHQAEKKESQSFAKSGDASVPKTTLKIKLSSESYHMTIRTTGKSTRPLCNLLIHRCYGNCFYSTKKFSKYSCLFRVLNGPKILINSTSFFGWKT